VRRAMWQIGLPAPILEFVSEPVGQARGDAFDASPPAVSPPSCFPSKGAPAAGAGPNTSESSSDAISRAIRSCGGWGVAPETGFAAASERPPFSISIMSDSTPRAADLSAAASETTALETVTIP
jgi:hypothetical protein